jgi:Ca-activated chloride channel family protein
VKSHWQSVGIVGIFLVVCAIVIGFARAKSDDPAPGSAASASVGPGAPTGPAVEILISSSDGKREWLEDVVKAFHASKAEAAGKPIRVTLLHMKSGESMAKILDGKEKPTLWSPAGQSWIDLLNTTWKGRTGHDFAEGVKPTVMSGLVVAMWEPMARSLGWPAKPIGWDDIFKVAMDPKGWGSQGHPEWGPFRFGHGHPDFSTSAMLSMVSSIYAAAGKTQGLSAEDLKDPRVIERVGALERSIVHYGESSSWLTEKLCTKGPAYLSAVTLYESSVVQANDRYKKDMPFRLVAIYPKEGTFWENHPTGIVNADWVTPEQHEAAAKLLSFMTSSEQQQKALKYGSRPSDNSIPLGAPIDEAHGADSKQTADHGLAYVSEDVFRRSNELWHKVKKHSTVFMLLDTSGSMAGEKMNSAKKGAAGFIRAMEKDDKVAVITFSATPRLVRPLASIRESGEGTATEVESLFADGGTAMYDATVMAFDAIDRARKEDPTRLYGVVLLSDGKDTSSKLSLSELLDRMPGTEAADGTRVFSVAYGEDADGDLLKQISNRSNARSLAGDSGNIDKIYHQISAYF